ncbi:polyketide synthase [Streptomyces yanii]|uniref:beta-ketoacyl [acyl carrier protein] synthase domain-containing protein n=1 Tax=Streptomyces yanii TaxID=78510 RepID=UPI0031E56812
MSGSPSSAWHAASPGHRTWGEFWENLTAGRDSITEVPRSRWDPDRYYRATPQPGRSLSRWGGFLDGVENFDAGYFGMSDAEGAALDPAIRLFLEAVATGLSDAGYEPHELRGDDIGVFVGGRTSDYATRAGLHQQILQSDQHFIAAHVAHHFDWHGPNLVVDSACSSSLVAVRLAMQSLLAGDCTTAVVGGGPSCCSTSAPTLSSARPARSPRPADVTPSTRARDGFVPGEGCGVVVLKPLSAALADGDRIHAVIESTAVNNDGQTMAGPRPNPAAQAAVVRRALARAGRTAGEIGLIEAHGTGTLIGDPLELRALTDVFRESTDATGFCAIGSVKSNLGHLLAAAGLAGLLKAVLSVEHGVLPPTLFARTPTRRFDFARSPFFPNNNPVSCGALCIPVSAARPVARGDGSANRVVCGGGVSCSLGLGGMRGRCCASCEALSRLTQKCVPCRGRRSAVEPVYRGRGPHGAYRAHPARLYDKASPLCVHTIPSTAHTALSGIACVTAGAACVTVWCRGASNVRRWQRPRCGCGQRAVRST